MERRLAAIFVADLVSFSRLMEADEANAISSLHDFQKDLVEPIFGASGGRIFKQTGDGLLAEFSSVVDAVSCGIELQRALASWRGDAQGRSEFALRIGIHLGDVVVEGDDLLGDGVNVAARLQEKCDPGAICLSRQAYEQVERKLPLNATHIGPCRLKNISRPIDVTMVRAGDGTPDSGVAKMGSRRTLLVGAALVTAGAAALLLYLGTDGEAPLPPALVDDRATLEDAPTQASVAILPFRSVGADLAHIGDGISDGLISMLSQVPGLLVISRQSSFVFRDGGDEYTDIAATLGASYLVRGTVDETGDGLSVDASLLLGSTGAQVWHGSWQGDLTDALAMPLDIAEEITSALSLEWRGPASGSVSPLETTSEQALELFMRGKERFLRFSREDTFAARRYFTRAIEVDTRFARAYAYLAWTFAFEFSNGWSKDPDETLDTALTYADMAIDIRKDRPVAYFVRALVRRERGEIIDAMADAQIAMELDPSYANAYVMMATLLYYGGRPEEGLALIEKAEEINPIHPSNYPFHKGQALFTLGRYSEAKQELSRGLEQNPSSERLRVWLAATLAMLGEVEEAEWEIEQIYIENPDFKLSQLRDAFPFDDPRDGDRFYSALAEIGLN